VVRLVPMTNSEFEMYFKRAVENYAQEHVRAGNWHPSEALQEAENSFLRLLPKGTASENQFLFSLEDSVNGARIGMIWFAVINKAGHLSAFIYDFMIDEEYRRKGYGKQALTALEEKAKEMNLDTISLHVFGHNKAAIALYHRVGYELTDLHMRKRLSV
jgi:ribosomal protein S18 acetylase RimI-like enzyme